MTALARLHAAAYSTPWPAAIARGVVLSLSDARELFGAAREGCDECTQCDNCGSPFCEAHAYGEPGCTHREPLCLSCIGSCRECADALSNDPDWAYDVWREDERG